MPRLKPTIPGNDGPIQLIAQLVYSLLSESKEGRERGVDLVRPPNPRYADAVCVLMRDGRDVVIRFEEIAS